METQPAGSREKSGMGVAALACVDVCVSVHMT